MRRQPLGGGIEMESIPGYDDWKTTPPDDPEPASVCDCCGKYLWEGEPIYLDINGETLNIKDISICARFV